MARYGEVYLDDYYDLVGIKSPNGTSDVYGWTDLAYTSVLLIADGYIIDFPKPKPIIYDKER